MSQRRNKFRSSPHAWFALKERRTPILKTRIRDSALRSLPESEIIRVWTLAGALLFLPEGEPIIAQQFIAGLFSSIPTGCSFPNASGSGACPEASSDVPQHFTSLLAFFLFDRLSSNSNKRGTI
jgi:hypothetical protein